MKITFLGSGAAHSDGERRNSSLIIAAGGHYLLVDCGGHVAADIQQYGLKVTDIKLVLLTHSHVDHLFGLPSLVHCLWLDSLPNGGAELTIFGNPATLTMATQLLDLFMLRTRKHAPTINLVPLDVGARVCELGTARVDTFEVSHGDMPTNGIVVSEGDRRMVFSADSEVCAPIEKLIDASTLLIHDCCGEKGVPGHAGAVEIAALCARTRPSRVILSHLPASRVEKAQALVKSVARRSKCKVIAASDGLKVTW